MLDLAGLNQRQRLEQLVQRPEPAGKDDERVEYLTNIVFRTKKNLKLRLRVT